MMKKLISLSIGYFAVCLLYCLGQAGYAEDGIPKRVISLGPSITESLYLLGAEDRLVGVTTYCQKPPQALKKERIGTVAEINIEKIISLKPDLVLATSLSNYKAVEKLKGLNIRVETFPYATDFAYICNEFLRLGNIVGRIREAEAIVGAARLRAEKIKEGNKDLPKPKVFVQLGSKPLFTVTKDSFINTILEFAGGINIVSGADIGFYSREKVLKDNPDVIIITTMGLAGERERKDWMRYKTLNAARDGRIYIVDPYKLCIATPPSFIEALEGMVKILHPENGPR